MFEILYNIYKLRNDINEFFICYQATSAIDFCLVAFSVGVASYKFFTLYVTVQLMNIKVLFLTK